MVDVSIIIPVYNRIVYIEDAVKSAIAQDLHKKEIIIVDDGSFDECRKLLIDMEAKYEELNVIYQTHKGAGVARNKGLECSHGKYVCFLDSDDYYDSNDSLKKLFERAEENSALICGGNIVDIDTDGNKAFRGYVFENEGWMNIGENPVMYGHTRYIYNRQFLINNEIKYDELTRFEDPPFVLKAFALAKKYYVVKDIVYGCRKYKRDKLYSYDVVMDILKGVSHSLDIIEKYHLITLESFSLENTLWSVYEQCCYLVYIRKDDEVIKLIYDISRKLHILINKSLNVLNEIKVREWLESALELLIRLEKETKVLIYGAGIVARRLLESPILEKNNILGIAVTDSTSNKLILNGIPVKCINDYSVDKDCLVIIAVSIDKATLIEHNLNIMGFNNCLKIDERGIKLITAIMMKLI